MNEFPPEDEVPKHALAMGATLMYGVFVLIAVLWFWLREEQTRLAELAVGNFGPLISLVVGLVAGLVLSWVIWLATRYLKPFTKLESRLQQLVGALNETEIIAISMASAIGEEMLFRGALQDRAGPYLTAVVFGLLHIGPGLLIWTFMATALGLAFGLMVDAGLGLLSVTVAHALINFIALRRMAIQ